MAAGLVTSTTAGYQVPQDDAELYDQDAARYEVPQEDIQDDDQDDDAQAELDADNAHAEDMVLTALEMVGIDSSQGKILIISSKIFVL